ncbi:RelA/SpoT domain-containing protein [Cysteiniphilum sp. JM-1]|uniref:RelA/SpoT domain-containing protein n=1 Tax=Cysteiniphilum sp. JM-1 TaxID=2610891 RepID=UPI001246F7A4|nr:RelA/SpoT domain-containing protein [Cysteiniphilum sp. JM-1]
MVTDEQTISKSQADKAGKILRNHVTDEALQALSNWRAMHAQPLTVAYKLLKQKAKILDKGAILSQRLKRTPSITAKLQRYLEMKLSRMQDIGGCRCVLASKEQVLTLADQLAKKVIKIEKNYFDSPKKSGYRSLHLSYKYNPTKEENAKYQGLTVEVQLRTKVQHAWATAVEIVGLFNREMLKASTGNEKWLEFFARVSDEFAKMEQLPTTGLFGDNNVDQIIKLDNELNALATLSKYRVTTQFIDKKAPSIGEYYLLILQDQEIKIQPFTKNGYQRAVETYLALEKQFNDDRNTDIVLINAQPLKELKKAYPNYFADSHEFIRLAKQTIKR